MHSMVNFLSLGFGNILKFSSKKNTNKNRNTLIILKTHIVPKITQKKKIKPWALVYLIALRDVEIIAAQKCTFISPNASSALWFTTLKMYPDPKNRNQRSHMHGKHRSKRTGIEIVCHLNFIKNTLKYWCDECWRSVISPRWWDGDRGRRILQVSSALLWLRVCPCRHLWPRL